MLLLVKLVSILYVFDLLFIFHGPYGRPVLVSLYYLTCYIIWPIYSSLITNPNAVQFLLSKIHSSYRLFYINLEIVKINALITL